MKRVRFCWGSNVRDDNSILSVDLTDPDIYLDQQLVLPKDMLHIVRTLFLCGSRHSKAVDRRELGHDRVKLAPRAHCPKKSRKVVCLEQPWPTHGTSLAASPNSSGTM